jgi:hypothetical protein
MLVIRGLAANDVSAPKGYVWNDVAVTWCDLRRAMLANRCSRTQSTDQSNNSVRIADGGTNGCRA